MLHFYNSNMAIDSVFIFLFSLFPKQNFENTKQKDKSDDGFVIKNIETFSQIKYMLEKQCIVVSQGKRCAKSLP